MTLFNPHRYVFNKLNSLKKQKECLCMLIIKRWRNKWCLSKSTVVSNWLISIQQRTLHTGRREDVRYVCTKSKTGSTAPKHVHFLEPPRGWGRGRGLLEPEEPSPGAPREEPAISLIAGPVWWNMFVCGTVFATLFFVVVCVEALK